MIQEILLLALLIGVVIIVKPEFFNWFFYKIKTKYLKPEVSIFELLTIVLIILVCIKLLAWS
jgi:hypothetical protein|tara:strand:- start:42 stop:227 length:186 start_codon:yes stop_codon:yes gene_type:complete